MPEDTVKKEETTQEKPKITAGELLLSHEKEIQKIATVLDIIYLQLATVIEVLSDKGLIDPNTWAQKLDSVGKQIEARMVEETRKIEEETKKKIVVPESKIIIP